MLKEIERQYYQEEMPKVREAIKEFKEEIKQENPDWVKRQRLVYLDLLIRELMPHIRFYVNVYKQLNHEKRKYARRRYRELNKELDRIKMRIRLVKHKKDLTKNKITPDMIINAREYPLQNLITLNKYNKALCPFHEDKIPSFSVKNNRFRCFGCNEHGDSIDFIIKRDNLNFIEAVKYLNGG